MALSGGEQGGGSVWFGEELGPRRGGGGWRNITSCGGSKRTSIEIACVRMSVPVRVCVNL